MHMQHNAAINHLYKHTNQIP